MVIKKELIKKLKNYLVKHYNITKGELDYIDLEAEYDSRLPFHENVKLIAKKYRLKRKNSNKSKEVRPISELEQIIMQLKVLEKERPIKYRMIDESTIHTRTYNLEKIWRKNPQRAIRIAERWMKEPRRLDILGIDAFDGFSKVRKRGWKRPDMKK